MYIYHLNIHYMDVWMYKFANYELFNRKIFEFDWSCLHEGTIKKQVHYLQMFLLNLLNCAYQI